MRLDRPPQVVETLRARMVKVGFTILIIQLMLLSAHSQYSSCSLSQNEEVFLTFLATGQTETTFVSFI